MTPPYCYPGPKRLAGALKLAGFSDTGTASLYGSELRTMLGIAYAESSGDAFQININTDTAKSKDYGVWQINDYYEGEKLLKSLPEYKDYSVAQLSATFGTDRRKWFHEYERITGKSWASWTDNAVMAYIGYKKSGFKSWVAYTSGALNSPSRVDWNHVDYGITKLHEEEARGYGLYRISSVFLEALEDGPLKQ